MWPAYRILITVVAFGGVLGVLPIVYAHVRGSSCPLIGPLPACYVVILAYAVVALSVLLDARPRMLTFLAGWIPLFVLAATGSALEIIGIEACPRTGYGIPTCFISLLMVLFLAAFFVLGWVSRTSEG